jgi:hypothetical protein
MNRSGPAQIQCERSPASVKWTIFPVIPSDYRRSNDRTQIETRGDSAIAIYWTMGLGRREWSISSLIRLAGRVYAARAGQAPPPNIKLTHHRAD